MVAESPGTFEAPAVLIEIEDSPAGLAFRERGGFRFIAVDRRFRLLDGSRFRRISQIEVAVRSMLRAATPL